MPPTPNLDEIEKLLEQIAVAVAVDPWGASFWATVLATLIGVAVGAYLSWLAAHRIQRRERADKYSERLDDRNLLWMDALDAFANRLGEEARVFGALRFSAEPSNRRSVPERFTPSAAVEEALRVFRTRIRQASLIARGSDLAVVTDIETDVWDNWHESTLGDQLDPEFITRMHMLVEAFMDYRRGELHASWFAYWRRGTQMPFVNDDLAPMEPAPSENPTAVYRRLPGR
ncbi:hypothetical protein MRBLMI12_000255 [Microbacterium sp. LMI12-1-1.1]|uniref:hypothetical protein n=1 Tax=Microbacterium sp. LMI12-1-1.1 TaxID=3135225 RepID=UPI003436C2FC